MQQINFNPFQYSLNIYNRPKQREALTTAAILQKKTGLDTKLNTFKKKLLDNYVSQGDAQGGGLESRLAKKFNTEQEYISQLINQNPQVKKVMDSFRSVLQRSIVGFKSIAQRLKGISPKAKETPSNLVRLRNQLNTIKKEMDSKIKEIHANAKNIDKVVEEEIPRKDMDACKFWFKLRTEKPISKTRGISTYKLDPTKVPLFMDYVNGMFRKTPKEFAKSFDNKDIVKKFQDEVRGKLKVYEKFAENRALAIHLLEQERSDLTKNSDYNKLELNEQKAAVKLFDEQVYKPGLKQLNTSEYNEGEIERGAQMIESVLRGQAAYEVKNFVKKNKENIKTEAENMQISEKIDKKLKPILKKIREKYLAKLKEQNPELAKKQSHNKFVRQFGIACSQMLQILKAKPEYKDLVAAKGKDSDIETKLTKMAEDVMKLNSTDLPSITRAELKPDGTIQLNGKNTEKLHLEQFDMNIKFDVVGKNFGEKAGQASLANLVNPLDRISTELNKKLQPNLAAHLKKFNFTEPVAKKLARKIAATVPTEGVAERIMAQDFKMNIVGTASPEGGSYEGNLGLAKRRAEAARNAIIKKFKLKPSAAKNITIAYKVVDQDGNEVKNDQQAQQIYKNLADKWNKSLKSQPSFDQKDLQTPATIKKLISRYNRSAKGFNSTFVRFLDENLKNKRGFEYSMNVESSGAFLNQQKLDNHIS